MQPSWAHNPALAQFLHQYILPLCDTEWQELNDFLLLIPLKNKDNHYDVFPDSVFNNSFFYLKSTLNIPFHVQCKMSCSWSVHASPTTQSANTALVYFYDQSL